MDYKHIDQVLEKYWAGESSLEEEKILKSYFQGSDIPPRHQSLKPLFDGLEKETALELSADFDQQLQDRLKSNVKPIRKKSPGFYLLRIAAAVTLIFALWMLVPQASDPALAEVDRQEIEEAKRTYQQAKAALLYLSKKMEKGTQTAILGISELEQATARVKSK